MGSICDPCSASIGSVFGALMRWFLTFLLGISAAVSVTAQPPSSQDAALAVLALKRALLSSPRDADIALQWQQTVGETTTSLSLGSLSDELAAILTIQEHSAVTFGLWWLLNILFILGVVSKRLRPWAASVRVLVLAGLVLCGSTLALRVLVDVTQPRAVVLIDTVMRVGPDKTFLDTEPISSASLVRVLREDNGWVLITTATSTSGWIPRISIEYVIPPDLTASG
jgi:hypothetical protein